MSLAYFRMKFSSLKMKRERVFVAAMPGRLMFVARFAMFLSDASGLPPRRPPSSMPPASDVRFAILLNESIVRERHGKARQGEDTGGRPLTFHTALPQHDPYCCPTRTVRSAEHCTFTHTFTYTPSAILAVLPGRRMVSSMTADRCRGERRERRTSAGETESCTAMTSPRSRSRSLAPPAAAVWGHGTNRTPAEATAHGPARKRHYASARDDRTHARTHARAC